MLASGKLAICTDDYQWDFFVLNQIKVTVYKYDDPPLCVEQNYTAHPLFRVEKLMSHRISTISSTPSQSSYYYIILLANMAD